MRYIKGRYVKVIWATSVSASLFTIVSVFLAQPQDVFTAYLIPLEPRINNSIVLALFLALLPPAVAYSINIRYKRAVVENIPRFLRGLMDDVHAGMAFPRALEEASKRDYGPISEHLKVAISQFIMGMTLEEALKNMGRRLRHPQGVQVTTILVEAYLSGGKIREVLNTAVDIYATFTEYRELRRTNVRPYAILIDLAVVVFLVISFVILGQFLGPLQEAAGTGLLTGILPLEYYASILFWGSIFESLFGGIIGGKIGEGTVTAGLTHSVVLMSITLVFFNLLIFQQVIVL